MMEETIHEDKTFEKVNFTQKELKIRSFDNCTFIQCDFSSSTLNNNTFSECTFTGCNMALSRMQNTSLKDVSFKNCKLIGINFYECADFLFNVNFNNCILDYTSFAGKKMIKTKFIGCTLKDANFSNCDLSEAAFSNCNLEGTIFSNTQLRGTDFTTAVNYAIDLDINSVKKAKFSKHGQEGLLAKYDINIL